jgi:hypothetical protein
LCLRVTLDDETDNVAAQEAASTDDEHFAKRLYIFRFRHAVGVVKVQLVVLYFQGIVLRRELGGSNAGPGAWVSAPRAYRVFNGSDQHSQA